MVYFHHYSPPLRGIVEYAYIIFLPVSQLVLLRLEKVTSRKRESFCLFVFIYLFIYLFIFTAENPCSGNQHGCEHICYQAGGQDQCSCNAGYELNQDGKTCSGEFLESRDN